MNSTYRWGRKETDLGKGKNTSIGPLLWKTDTRRVAQRPQLDRLPSAHAEPVVKVFFTKTSETKRIEDTSTYTSLPVIPSGPADLYLIGSSFQA